jgi:ParB-like chromosome segregation protein Spo0J
MPRITKHIPLSSIDVDHLPINPATLSLVDHIRDGGSVSPIRVHRVANGRFKLGAGRHRYVAHKLLGRTTIEAKLAEDYPKGQSLEE